MCGHTLSHIDPHVSTTHADSKNSKIVQLKCFASSNIAIPGAKIAFWMFFFFVALRNVIETSCETNKGWFPEKIGREKFYGSGLTFLDAFPAPAGVTFCHFFRGPLSPPRPPPPTPSPSSWVKHCLNDPSLHNYHRQKRKHPWNSQDVLFFFPTTDYFRLNIWSWQICTNKVEIV